MHDPNIFGGVEGSGRRRERHVTVRGSRVWGAKKIKKKNKNPEQRAAGAFVQALHLMALSTRLQPAVWPGPLQQIQEKCPLFGKGGAGSSLLGV